VRKDVRIIPKKFQDYIVRIDLDEITLEGDLGNISDSGLCIIMDNESLKDEVGSHITGAIFSKPLSEYIDFEGRILWTKEYPGKETRYLYGVEFDSSIRLTQTLLLKSLTED